jgi:hypothetical protein
VVKGEVEVAVDVGVCFYTAQFDLYSLLPILNSLPSVFIFLLLLLCSSFFI